MSDNAEHRQKWKEWREFQRDVRQYRSDDKQRSLIHQGRKRFYRVYVPPVYSDDYLFPVVFYLHGGGGNELNAEKMGLTKIADKYQFILVSPAGTGASNRLPFYVWNAGVWGEGECCGYAYEKKIDDVGFIRKILAEMKASYRIDKKSIYATGISNGGMMSYRLACEMSDVFAAIAPVAPPAVPEPCSPQPISVMHVIGDKDPCVKIEGGKVGGCLAKAMGMKQRIDFIARPSQYMIDRFVTNNECENLAFESSLNTEAHCVTYRGCKEEREVQY
ncbi:MAG: hypothetical protein HKM24_06450, partial [Gammaproteobacteria bacterium]|nr:hypothetical protein [Gammaproteobacteria bacterium]